MPTARARKEWSRRAVAEYASAGLAAQASHWMIQAGFPEDIVRLGLRIVSDELDHSRLSHETLLEIGGPETKIEFNAQLAAFPNTEEGIFFSLTDTIIHNFCMGETFAVPLFRAMRQNALQPKAVETLDRILKDEAVHRAFGWQALEILIQLDKGAVQKRIDEKFKSWIASFQGGYGEAEKIEPLLSVEKEVGMIDGINYVKIFNQTRNEWIVPGMHKRGLKV